MNFKTTFRKLLLLIIVPTLMFAQIGLLNPYTIADISGTSTRVALSTVFVPAKLIQFTTPCTNSSNVRYGDTNTSATQGTPILPCSKDNIGASGNGYFNLANISVYVETGDKLSVMYWYGN